MNDQKCRAQPCKANSLVIYMMWLMVAFCSIVLSSVSWKVSKIHDVMIETKCPVELSK